MREYLMTWESAEGFRLDLFDTGTLHRGGPQQRLAYVFRQDGNVIFRGADFGCSPMNAIDSAECIIALLGFLSLQDGDTDDDYFADYTPEQLEWRDEYAEALSMYALDGDKETLTEVRNGMRYDEGAPRYAPMGVDA